MKTVEFSLKEIIGEIDETTIEQIYFKDKACSGYAYNRKSIEKNILSRISQGSPRKYTIRTRTRIAFALLLILLFSSITVYASYKLLNRSSAVDDSNQSLIGKEVKDSHYYIYDHGHWYDENQNEVDMDQLTEESNIFPENNIVQSSTLENFIPSSFLEMTTSRTGNIYTIPEIMLINNSPCLLKTPNGKGWELTTDESVTITYDKYAAQLPVNQKLMIGYIKDGIMYEGIIHEESSSTYTFYPTEQGEYYFYLLNVSSDYLTLRETTLEIHTR